MAETIADGVNGLTQPSETANMGLTSFPPAGLWPRPKSLGGFFRARCSINRRPHLLDLVWIAPGSGTPHTGPSHISMMVMLCRLDGMAIVSQQGLELTTRTSLALVKHVGVGAHWCHPREEAESTFGAHKGGPCFRNAQRGGLLLTMLAAVGSSQAAQPQFEDGSVYRARWWAQLDSNQ